MNKNGVRELLFKFELGAVENKIELHNMVFPLNFIEVI